MIALLGKLFIKNHKDYSDRAVRKKYGFLTGFVGILLNILICAGKITVGVISSAVSVVADGINNLSDAASSVVTVVGFKIADKPVDKEHPYGHGRVEYVAAMLVSLIIMVIGVELAISAIKKIVAPQAVNITYVTLVILGVSVAVKLYMFLYNYVWSKKLDSSVLKATALDSIADAVSTFVVFICAFVSMYWSLPVLDGCAGIAVAVFIIFTGLKSFGGIFTELVGKPPKKEFVENIEKAVSGSPMVLGVHDVIVHDYGPGRVMVSLHVEVPADTDLLTSHDCVDEIENKLEKEFRCYATIHVDPVVRDPESMKLRKMFLKRIKECFPSYSIHDFRISGDKENPTVSFDVLAPFIDKSTEEEIKDEVMEKIKDVAPSYTVLIRIDRPFN